MLDQESLFSLTKREMSKLAEKYNIDTTLPEDIFLSMLLYKDRMENGQLSGYGELEVMPDGYGFLRNSSAGQDIYISGAQIKKLAIRSGDLIVSDLREPFGNEKNYGVIKVLLVNGKSLDDLSKRIKFDDLEPSYPDERIPLEGSVACRLIDLIAPIGKGQRALIVAPPKAGKTMLMCELANAILKQKNIEVWMLLIDERPEEVTDIKHNVKGAKVFASTFDENPNNHIKVVENVLERAKRALEYGKNIVILMDNLTRLARSYNMIIPSSGKLISGGLDPLAFTMPKKFFGAARKTKEGSLTIIATALVDTGSKMDDIIYEEFKGTGNMEIHLSRQLAELRIFPSVSINESGTRREELLYPEKTLKKIWTIRRYLSSMNELDATKKLIDLIKTTKSNQEIFDKFNGN